MGGPFRRFDFLPLKLFLLLQACHVKFRTANIVGASAARVLRDSSARTRRTRDGDASTYARARQAKCVVKPLGRNLEDATCVCCLWNSVEFAWQVFFAPTPLQHHDGLNSCKQPRQPDAEQSPQTEWSKRRQQRLNSCITCK